MIQHRLRKILTNKKGGLIIPMVPIVIAFMIAVMGALEYFVTVSAYSDIQSIMDLVANSSLRRGVKHDIHKDEQIIDTTETGIIISTNNSIDTAIIRKTYNELLYEKNLKKSIAMNSIVDVSSFKIMKKNDNPSTDNKDFIEDNDFRYNPAFAQSPEIRLEKTKWSNTFTNQDKVVDTVILDAVAEVDFKTRNYIQNRVLNYVVTQKSHLGNTEFKVEVKNKPGDKTTLLIRSSTRMILR